MNTSTDAQGVNTIDRDFHSTQDPTIRSDHLFTRRLNLMRAGYLLMGVGLAITKWPVILHDPASLPVMDGVVAAMLTAMSLWPSSACAIP